MIFIEYKPSFQVWIPQFFCFGFILNDFSTTTDTDIGLMRWIAEWNIHLRVFFDFRHFRWICTCEKPSKTRSKYSIEFFSLTRVQFLNRFHLVCMPWGVNVDYHHHQWLSTYRIECLWLIWKHAPNLINRISCQEEKSFWTNLIFG